MRFPVEESFATKISFVNPSPKIVLQKMFVDEELKNPVMTMLPDASVAREVLISSPRGLPPLSTQRRPPVEESFARYISLVAPSPRIAPQKKLFEKS
jgi:hypothetical protein